jgi:hypothetical protein
MAVLLLWSLGAVPSSAQEWTYVWTSPTAIPQPRTAPVAGAVYGPPVMPTVGDEQAASSTADPAPAWQPAWGVVSLRGIPGGLKIAPNGLTYHPNFSLDLNFNFWLWRSQGLYAFADMGLWGETGANGSTNGRDGFLGTSKRQFDLTGGVAWNYWDFLELRAFGYTQNNLNRGTDLSTPIGFQDGFGLENRWYLSPEYAKLGQPGFDVTRATFVSIGYYPSKSMVGNDGQSFQPGLLLRAYLIYDLWDWPCYVYGDVTYISERSFRPRLLLFDVGLALRPFHACPQCEFRLGGAGAADLQVRNDLNLWYVALRYIY